MTRSGEERIRKNHLVAFFVAWLVCSLPVAAQRVLIFTDGTVMPFKKFASKELLENLDIIDEKKKKIFIPVSKVAGYYELATGKTFHKVNLSEGYKFLERELEGAIWLCKERIAQPGHYTYTPGPGMGTMVGGGSTLHYYLYNGSSCEEVLIRNGLFQDREEKAKVLRKFIADDEAVLKIAEAENFYLDYNALVDIVRQYNVRKFNTVPGPHAKQGSVNFYARIRSKADQALTLKVNDSIEYKIPETSPLSIRVPTGTVTKICVVTDSGSLCDIISGSPAALRNFELKFNSNKNSFDIEETSMEELQKYIMSVNAQKRSSTPK